MMKNNKKNQEPYHYWLVEFTLTSGEIHEFYVKARTKTEADAKALSFEYLAELPKIRTSKFVLRN